MSLPVPPGSQVMETERIGVHLHGEPVLYCDQGKHAGLFRVAVYVYGTREQVDRIAAGDPLTLAEPAPAEDLPPHPDCGICGTPRDLHDSGARPAGHRWQWTRRNP